MRGINQGIASGPGFLCPHCQKILKTLGKARTHVRKRHPEQHAAMTQTQEGT